jgi:hypothetical protein
MTLRASRFSTGTGGGNRSIARLHGARNLPLKTLSGR